MKAFVDSCGHKRIGVEKQCPSCSNVFVTRKDRPNNTCSKNCERLYASAQRKLKMVDLVCAQCGNKFRRMPGKLAASKSKLYFCNRICKEKAQRITGGIPEIQPDHYGDGKYVKYRSYFDHKDLRCRRCNYCEFAIAIQIHHIDHDRTNNSMENLIPLCACCHCGLHAGCWTLDSIGPLV